MCKKHKEKKTHSSGVRIISHFFFLPRFLGTCPNGCVLIAPFIMCIWIWCCCCCCWLGHIVLGGVEDGLLLQGVIIPGGGGGGWPGPGPQLITSIEWLSLGLLLDGLMPPIDISSSTNEYGSTGVSHFIDTCGHLFYVRKLDRDILIRGQT